MKEKEGQLKTCRLEDNRLSDEIKSIESSLAEDVKRFDELTAKISVIENEISGLDQSKKQWEEECVSLNTELQELTDKEIEFTLRIEGYGNVTAKLSEQEKILNEKEEILRTTDN